MRTHLAPLPIRVGGLACFEKRTAFSADGKVKKTADALTTSAVRLNDV